MSAADRDVAREWVSRTIEGLREQPYESLLEREGDADHIYLPVQGGEDLLGETHVIFDDKRAGTLRVIVDVWNLRQKLIWRPIAKDQFIRAPDGSFVDE